MLIKITDHAYLKFFRDSMSVIKFEAFYYSLIKILNLGQI